MRNVVLPLAWQRQPRHSRLAVGLCGRQLDPDLQM